MSDKIYDNTFKTIAQKLPVLLIPLVNEAFGASHTPVEDIRQIPTEFRAAGRKVNADSVFRIGGDLYHLEVQSGTSTSMALRMLQYDLAISLAEASGEEFEARADMPLSCVVYLRDAPQRMRSLLTGHPGNLDTSPAVLNAAAYGPDEIRDKGLSILAPFQILKYDRRIRRDSGRGFRRAALQECSDALAAVREMGEPYGGPYVYNELHTMTLRIMDWVFRDDAELRQEARHAMDAEVFELVSERHERELREAREEGRESGREEGRTSFARQLLSLGVDESVIAQALTLS